ncbi:MAG: DUF2723 domain-containing protein [Myxococcota bacterium]|nr:DUF2723 domain-containing protein [Myxococcota bacterium]
MNSAKREWNQSGLTAFLILLFAYCLTMCRGLMFFDAGELALVAAQYGLGHPPGQPGYTVLLAAWTSLMPFEPLTSMTLFSALCAALCAFPADGILRKFGIAVSMTRLVSILTIGLLYPVWDQATRIELYSLMTLLMLFTLNTALSVKQRSKHEFGEWFKLGLLAGLIVTINPIHGLATAAGAGLLSLGALLKTGIRKVIWTIAAAVAGSMTGLLPYTYLFWVRNTSSRFVWGDLKSTEGLWHYLTGQDYAHTDHTSWASIPEHAGDWLIWSHTHGFLAFIVVGMIGLGATQQLRRTTFLWGPILLAGSVFSFSYGQYYPDVPDFSAYLVPSLWVMGFGAVCLFNRVQRDFVLPMCLILLAVPPLMNGRVLPDRSDNDLAVDLATRWLQSLPENAILLAETDHLVFPIMYRQQVDQIRPDVVVVNIGFASSRWYWNQLFEQHPDLKPVPLAAPGPGIRLRRFLLANQTRPFFAESINAAPLVGMRPCVAQFGIAMGQDCKFVDDRLPLFQETMRGWWSSEAANDPISAKVLAFLSNERARAYYALGHVNASLQALSVGAKMQAGQTLPIPDELRATRQALNWSSEGQLLGSNVHNLKLGYLILRGQSTELSVKQSELWLDKAAELSE